MASNAIEIRNLGKMYKVGEIETQAETLLASLIHNLKGPARRLASLWRGNSSGAADMHKEFWALRHLNLEVRDGETLGIIGTNGSGKSTLLKILAQITEPTEGSARISGRVGSLLEVGTGFNSELTGRENIYLNGSILGMSLMEIDRKFEQILEFSGISDFIDTPVKHYSSGMIVRLAFSVAAHLEPEILLIDEVLAVGDYEFQKKSLNKMKEITSNGRTALFVSHQLDMVREICDRVILLKAGEIEAIGQPDEVIDYYLKGFRDDNPLKSSFSHPVQEERPFQFLAGRILNASGVSSSVFGMFEPITLEFDYVLRSAFSGLNLNFVLHRNGEALCMSFDTDKNPERLDWRDAGIFRTQVTLPYPLLKEGIYEIEATLGVTRGRRDLMHKLNDIMSFEIVFEGEDKSTFSFTSSYESKVALKLVWETEKTK